MAEKFMALPESASFSEGRGAALGIKFVLFDGTQEEVEKKCEEARRLGLDSMEKEIDAMKGHAVWGDGYEVCKKWFDYVVKEEAVEEEIMGNDGLKTMKDTNHGGWRLANFHQAAESKTAELTIAEVAALRLYTTAAFKWINNPLRRHSKPHPLASATLFIYEGLKKLRALHLVGKTKFRSKYLWRGMKDRTISREFLVHGGTEAAAHTLKSRLYRSFM